MKSVDTVKRIMRLASEIEVKEVMAVGNKIMKEKDKEFLERKMKELGVPIVAYIPYDESVADADQEGIPTIDYAPDSSALKAINQLKEDLVNKFNP